MDSDMGLKGIVDQILPLCCSVSEYLAPLLALGPCGELPLLGLYLASFSFHLVSFRVFSFAFNKISCLLTKKKKIVN